MKGVVLYEQTGTVRDAFRAAGHDVLSVDVCATLVPGPHVQDDVWNFLKYHPAHTFDFIIAHPPCTYLTCSGLHHNIGNPRRQAQTDAAVAEVARLFALNCDRVYIENPRGCLSSRLRRPRQVVQPYQFGHDASKETNLWCGDLMTWDDYEPLVPTMCVKPRTVAGKKRWANQTDSGQDVTPDRLDRPLIRSTTYPGIAAAMAFHWGGLSISSALRYLAYQSECLTKEIARG